MTLAGRWQGEKWEKIIEPFFLPFMTAKKGINGFWIKRENIRIVNLWPLDQNSILHQQKHPTITRLRILIL
jgi:hypothetical protein